MSSRKRKLPRLSFGRGFVGHGRLGYRLADIVGFTDRHPGGLRKRLRSLRLWALDMVRRPWCLLVGCRYDTPVFDSWSLYPCKRCGCEMLGRTFADLEPAPADHHHHDYTRGDDEWLN